MLLKQFILFSSLHGFLVLANPQIVRPLIVGGITTPVSSAPWQISLQRNGSHYCGGSIYSTNIIITAAHCLKIASSWVLKIRAGSTNWNSGGVLVPVAAFKINENFDISTYVNDIAVIRLSSPLVYSSNIQNISLACSTPANGAPATVSGWGTTYAGATTNPTSLQSVNVTIVGRTQCASKAYGFGSAIKPTMICAADPGKDACQGDSGGPMVSEGVLVGIVSWGVGCANATYPGVYSDVAALRSWAVNASSVV